MGPRFRLGLFCLSWYLLPLTDANWDLNTFHMLVHNMTQTLMVTDCWACASGPHYIGAAWDIIPTSCLEPHEWNKTHLYAVPVKGKLQTPDPTRFVLNHHQYWPSAPICVTYQGNETFKNAAGDHVLPTPVGAYPHCNCTMEIHNLVVGQLKEMPSCLPQYLHDNKRITMSLNQLKITYSAFYYVVLHGLPPGVFWVCGTWAGRVLPVNWSGTCTLGTLVPAGIQFYPKAQPPAVWEPPPSHNRHRRSYDPKLGFDPSHTYLTEGQRFGAILFPAVGVGLNIKQIRKLSHQLEALANDTAGVATDLQAEVISIRETLLQYKLGLDWLFSRNGGFCLWLNKTRCCHLLDLDGKIVTDIQKVQEVATTIQQSYSTSTGWSLLDCITSWLPGVSWVKELFLGLIGLLVMILVVAGLIRCAVSFVSRKYFPQG